MKDIRFGPIKDPIQPGKYEELKYNSIYKTSLVCAKCHDSSNGNVQIYSTFTEWINSPAAKRGVQCQACHMQPRNTVIARSVSDEAISKRYEIASSVLTEPPRNDKLCSNMTDDEYLEKVKQIKEEIRAGNVYQVNLTREYSLETKSVDELDIYLRLRSASPNPYGCFFKTPFVSILSSSPEEFLFIKDGYIKTRPIKGTLAKNVFDIDPKNQAENIMIVDLERNDLGKICEYGSIHAEKLLEIESYKHLNHVVSTVVGKLKASIKLKEIFEAMFPSGSITGAPKIAAMKIINEIEPTKRSAYTGSFGYIKTDGTMNFNILIRTIFVQKNKITFNVGGAIVADSEPEAELEEIRLKARGIMQALTTV